MIDVLDDIIDARRELDRLYGVAGAKESAPAELIVEGM